MVDGAHVGHEGCLSGEPQDQSKVQRSHGMTTGAGRPEVGWTEKCKRGSADDDLGGRQARLENHDRHDSTKHPMTKLCQRCQEYWAPKRYDNLTCQLDHSQKLSTLLWRAPPQPNCHCLVDLSHHPSREPCIPTPLPYLSIGDHQRRCTEGSPSQ